MEGRTGVTEALARIEAARIASAAFLDLTELGLEELPEGLGSLHQLTALDLSGNRLQELPAMLSRLTRLESLVIQRNRLVRLAVEFPRSSRLEVLDLRHNRLAVLPDSLGSLPRLQSLLVDGNPLNVEASVMKAGPAMLLAYLRERELGQPRYESKLILLGHGGAGKTCLSRALRDEPFQHQIRTRGVNVDTWRTSHPSQEDLEVQLNLWDFEGQEISHQSHQFFLTRRSLYLVVFNGRDEARLERLEYWLDTIRARAPGCRALLVATQCEDAEPQVDGNALHDRYPGVLQDGVIAVVGCATGRGLVDLRARVVKAIATLEHLPWRWPPAYERAEHAVRVARQGRAHIRRCELLELFRGAGVPAGSCDVLVELFSDVGVLTAFRDNHELQDFIVLRPQWLTRAISLVLDDPALRGSRGEMDLDWLGKLWADEYPGMFAQFIACMRHFELCYPLESKARGELVPLRFDYVRPAVPWRALPHGKERRITYRFDLRPPAGLMGRFIVKTHHLIVRTPEHPLGVYWRNGVFLELGEGELSSQALCTWDEERYVLAFVVRSAFPQKLIEQLDFVANAVFTFFKGLTPVRHFGCVYDDEAPCAGEHAERRVAHHLRRDTPLLCDEGLHEIHPRTLLEGLASFGRAEAIREMFKEESERLAQLMGTGLDALQTRMKSMEQDLMVLNTTAQAVPAGLALQVRQAHQQLLHALTQERQSQTPCIFAIFPVRAHPLHPRSWFKDRFVLHLYCEAELPHFSTASWEFERPKEWWTQAAPVLRVLLTYLEMLGKPGLGVLGVALADNPQQRSLAQEVELMKIVVDALPRDGLKAGPSAGYQALSRNLGDASIERARAALSDLVADLDPTGHEAGALGNLRRYWLPDNRYRWLCPMHAQAHGLLAAVHDDQAVAAQ